jgi:hypothetical protein
MRIDSNKVRPWQQFRVGRPSNDPRKPERTCQQLYVVSHVAHLEAAQRIITDGRIRAGLIHDKSKLNQERIQVSWLSPNIWRQGSRYGSVSFDFTWPRLIEGHRHYWVESIAYGVPACRILVTTNDYAGHHALVPYDPNESDGPWWFEAASSTHYFNEKYCLEFMIERDIETAELWDLDFVSHHRLQCSLDPQNCPERGMSTLVASSRFLSRLAASRLQLPESVRANRGSRGRKFAAAAASFTTGQIMGLAGDIQGALTLADSNSLALARALLTAYVDPKLHGDIPYLAQHFRSRNDLRECFSRLITNLFAS